MNSTVKKPMIDRSAPSVETLPFGDLELAFVRNEADGSLHFVRLVGHSAIPFPIYEDGTISDSWGEGDCWNPQPSEKVSVVKPRDIHFHLVDGEIVFVPPASPLGIHGEPFSHAKHPHIS